jgi:hypothetical protein
VKYHEENGYGNPKNNPRPHEIDFALFCPMRKVHALFLGSKDISASFFPG